MHKTQSKEEIISSINEQIRQKQELLKNDLTAVHEEILNEIKELLRLRGEVENG